MAIAVLGSVLLLITSAEQPTDFGLRAAPGTAGGSAVTRPVVSSSVDRVPFDLASAASLGNEWGTVTSTTRTVAHNRAVGGVANSFHLKGRAIDIARRSGIRHAQIEAAYRNAGYHLVESLDEGDHSHFAFGTTPEAAGTPKEPAAATRWRIVYAPSR